MWSPFEQIISYIRVEIEKERTRQKTQRAVRDAITNLLEEQVLVETFLYPERNPKLSVEVTPLSAVAAYCRNRGVSYGAFELNLATEVDNRLQTNGTEVTSGHPWDNHYIFDLYPGRENSRTFLPY